MSPIDGYTEVRELGSGASGRVVHAVHTASGTPVAIKYLSERLCADETFRSRFRAEAQLLAGLRDQHLVRFYEYREWPAGAAIVMELVDGVTLRRLLDEHGPLPPEAALLLLKGSLLGLAAAHAVGVVHRDYKPANVLVDGSGASKLADFGIAVRAGARTPVQGTPVYLAPEQWAGAPPSPAGDVYSASTVFFECLTGHRPFHAHETTGELARVHATVGVPVHEVDEPLRELLARGLAEHPAQRPPSAAAFVEQLDRVAAAAYGEDWESRGRKRLALLAGLLATAFPLALAPGAGAPVAGTPAAGAPGTPALPAPQPPVDAPAAHPGPPWWRAHWPAVATGAAVVVIAVIVGAVIVVGGSSDSGDAGDSAGPERSGPVVERGSPGPTAESTTPEEPDDVVVVVERAVRAKGTAKFGYELDGCCEQQFRGAGKTTYDEEGSAADVSSYYNIPGRERGGPGGETLRGVVFPSSTYLPRGGGSWVEVATPSTDPEDGGGSGGDEMRTAFQLATVREAVAVEGIVELLRATDDLSVQRRGDRIVYRGNGLPEPGKPTESGYRELARPFVLELAKDYTPRKLTVTTEYALAPGDHQELAVVVSYTGWGGTDPVRRPF